MQRNVSVVNAFLPNIVIVIPLLATLLIALQVQAGKAPRTLKGCMDPQNKPVKTVYNDMLNTFAKTKSIMEGEEERYEIEVNPTHYYLSRETQQWLYLRQCANIKLRHQVIHSTKSRLNLREERDADCWAIKQMRRDERYRFSERTLKTIERDLERMDAEQWEKVFGGPRRRTSLSECLYEEKFNE